MSTEKKKGSKEQLISVKGMRDIIDEQYYQFQGFFENVKIVKAVGIGVSKGQIQPNHAEIAVVMVVLDRRHVVHARPPHHERREPALGQRRLCPVRACTLPN